MPFGSPSRTGYFNSLPPDVFGKALSVDWHADLSIEKQGVVSNRRRARGERSRDGLAKE